MWWEVRPTRSQTQKQIQGAKWRELRGGGRAGESHRLAFRRKGQHLGGGIPEYFQGFVTPHKKHKVHAHSQLLSVPTPPPPQARGHISAFCLEMLRRKAVQSRHPQARFSGLPSVGWTLPRLPSPLIPGLCPCHHRLGACRPADPPPEGLVKSLGTPSPSPQGT